MKTKIDISDFLIIIYWVKTFSIVEGKNFNYQNLMDQAETYKYKNTPLDTQIYYIDELMIDAYQIYTKMKETKEKFNKFIDDIDHKNLYENFDIKISDVKDAMIEQVQKYGNIFEDLMENYKFDDPEIRGIQKGFLSEKMSQYVIDEEYEKAAKVRDMIKVC